MQPLLLLSEWRTAAVLNKKPRPGFDRHAGQSWRCCKTWTLLRFRIRIFWLLHSPKSIEKNIVLLKIRLTRESASGPQHSGRSKSGSSHADQVPVSQKSNPLYASVFVSGQSQTTEL